MVASPLALFSLTHALDPPRRCRHFGETYDYRVGRAMFESTLLPAAWVHELRHMDEIWVPSHWGAKQFAAAGVPLEKIHVVPEPTDASLFHPLVVEKDYSLLPGSTDESFIFLSVFKWSNRKVSRSVAPVRA